MKWLEKLVMTISPFGLLLILTSFLILSCYLVDWWSTTPPSRPKGIPSNAVWLWAPGVGFPGSPRGDWLYCWEDKNTHHNRCRLIRKDGSLHYEGEFVLYNHPDRFVPEEQLIIDPEKTNRYTVGPVTKSMPIVFLRNGFILIPVDGYKEAIDILGKWEVPKLVKKRA